ncbi:MAG TPA: tRNA pseudouridine(13) synthase TruD, partial [Methanomicrobiales archaeon]|nr:tRNA pseudouridine(13) synthase TruD [Methanomicrobiales archaeon]
MIESPYPLEQSLGICYYLTDTPGIGGVLKKSPGDFIVDEIPAPLSGDGPYLIVRLTKENWDLQHAVKEIAKRLGMSHRRIGWAGTKDKRAITTQFISIYNGDREQVERLHIKDLSLEVVGRSPAALSLGMLEGNRFDITIRECERDSLSERVGSVAETISHGIPNYVGLQRFGVIRPITHRVGELILKEDYKGAALGYIGEAFPHEPSDIRDARDAFSRTLDIKAALKGYPTHLSYERSM